VTAMAQMRAAVLVAPKCFEIQLRDIPVPKSDETLIKIDRVGICGTDMHIFHGHYAADKLPLVPGHEFVGRIQQNGSSANRFKIGQCVVVDINVGCGHCYWCRRNEILSCEAMQQIGISQDGAFCDYLAVPERLVIPVPESMDAGLLLLLSPSPVLFALHAKQNWSRQFGCHFRRGTDRQFACATDASFGCGPHHRF